MPEATASADSLAVNQQIKPIVSDIMTVSSKETIDSRDDDDGNHKESMIMMVKQQPPPHLAPQGRYAPVHQPHHHQHQQHRRAPYPPHMQNRSGGPPFGPPPPPYYGYGQQQQPPPQYMMHNGPPPPSFMNQQHHQQHRNNHGPPQMPPYHARTMNHGGPPPNHHPHHGGPPPQPYFHGSSGPSSQQHHSARASANNSAGHYGSNNNMTHYTAYSNQAAAAAGGGNGNHTPQASSVASSTKSSLLGKKRSVEENATCTSTTTAAAAASDKAVDEERKESEHDDKKKHRRNLSGASTASSLSVGGYSFGSYEGARVDDHVMTDNSPKRRKGDQLIVDTSLRSTSSCSHSKGFEQMSIEHPNESNGSKLLPDSTSSASSAGQGNLFLSLSTSPINQTEDIDQTPVKKNTHKTRIAVDIDMDDDDDTPTEADKGPASIFKFKDGKPTIETTLSDISRPSDTPTPPASQSDLIRSSSMAEEHSLLNRHLRNQSFTPLPHLSTTNSAGASPSGAAFASAMAAPQLSWSIAGDTPSIGDLADWDDHHDNTNSNKFKMEQKVRPGSATSVSSARHMAMSPHDFQFWKEEDHEMADVTMSGTTTPLPAFFGHGSNSKEGTENSGARSTQGGQKMRDYEYGAAQLTMLSRGVGLRPVNNKQQHSGTLGGFHSLWSKQDNGTGRAPIGMPPTPVFANTDYRDDVHFGPRSPMGVERRERAIEYGSYPGFPPPHHPSSAAGVGESHNERVRNLRGRMPPNMHMPPMPLHIPPTMAPHLPMTSPMGLGPKAGLWSPHHQPRHHPFHGGMHPQMGSPHNHMHHHHHMGSPLNNMAQSKRKCVPLKPPIPSKFQGDMEGAKAAPVPEFTSLVNFPAHMSQKQSVNLPEGMRCCVMCGQACQCTVGSKAKKSIMKKASDGSLIPHNSNGQDCMGDKGGNYAMIPSQNKGLCTLCDVNVWVIVPSGLEIKWCKGCKNFRPWAAFGEKGLATKCLRCRDRQREKYALQKEEKEKCRATIKK